MGLTRKEEKKLIELAKRGDSEAMTTIYQEFGEEILRAAYGISKNQDDAQDIASEAFVSFFKNIQRFAFFWTKWKLYIDSRESKF